jgi:hypothetical protein
MLAFQVLAFQELAAVFGVRRVVGMGQVLVRVLFVRALVIGVFVVGLQARRRIRRSVDGRGSAQFGMSFRLCLARMNVVVLTMGMVVLVMRMVVIVPMLMIVVIMMLRIGVVMFAVVGVTVLGMQVFGKHAFGVVVGMVFKVRLSGQRRIRACAFDDLALDTLAIAAAARVAVTRTAAVGAVFALFLGLAMGALVGLDQCLAIGDRNLVIIRMDFAEGKEAVAVAAIFDEGRLQRRLYARDFGEVDVAAQLFALGGFEIKFFDAVAADHNDPGLFRVGGIYQHFVGHFGALGGGGRVSR